MARGAGSVDAQTRERLVRDRSEDPVLGHAVFLLERAHRRSSVLPEDPVRSSRVEPERVELSLQRSDIVAAEWRLFQVQRAIPAAPRRFDEFAPRLGTDDPVGKDLPALLEDADRLASRRAEGSAVVVDMDPEGPQAHLNVG